MRIGAQVTVGTDLLYAAVTKSCGAAMHGVNRSVNWRTVGWLATGSLPMSLLIISMLAHIGRGHHVLNALVTSALGPALILTALALVFRKRLVTRFGAPIRRLSDRKRIGWTILTGAILGVVVTLSSVGAGAIGLTALVLLDPDNEARRMVGSEIAHAVPLTLVAGIGHWVVGTVNFELLGALLLGSIPGVLVGSQISNRVPDVVMRPILALILFLVGGRMLLF